MIPFVESKTLTTTCTVQSGYCVLTIDELVSPCYTCDRHQVDPDKEVITSRGKHRTNQWNYLFTAADLLFFIAYICDGSKEYKCKTNMIRHRTTTTTTAVVGTTNNKSNNAGSLSSLSALNVIHRYQRCHRCVLFGVVILIMACGSKYGITT